MNREKDLESLMPLIRRRAASIARRVPLIHVSEEDLVQAAALEVWKALPRYDPSAGVRLAAWICHRIDGAIVDHLRDRGRLLHGGKRTGRREKIARIDCQQDKRGRTIPFPDPKSPAPPQAAEGLENFHDMLVGLTQIERIVVVLRYRDDMKMKAIGAQLELSESRISQILSQVHARIGDRVIRQRRAA